MASQRASAASIPARLSPWRDSVKSCQHGANFYRLATRCARGMEFNYDFAGKLLAAMLLLLVVSDQLTTPATDPRDGDATPAAEVQPPSRCSASA